MFGNVQDLFNLRDIPSRQKPHPQPQQSSRVSVDDAGNISERMSPEPYEPWAAEKPAVDSGGVWQGDDGTSPVPVPYDDVPTDVRPGVPKQPGDTDLPIGGDPEHQLIDPGGNIEPPKDKPRGGPLHTLDPFGRMQGALTRQPYTGVDAGTRPKLPGWGYDPNKPIIDISSQQANIAPFQGFGGKFSAFEQQVRCMSPNQLQSLKNSLFKQMNAIQPGTRARNLQKSDISRQISIIIFQLKKPKPCAGGSVGGPGPGRPVGGRPKPKPRGGTVYDYDMPDPERISGAPRDVVAPELDLYAMYEQRAVERQISKLEDEVAAEKKMSGLFGISPDALTPSQEGADRFSWAVLGATAILGWMYLRRNRRSK